MKGGGWLTLLDNKIWVRMTAMQTIWCWLKTKSAEANRGNEKDDYK